MNDIINVNNAVKASVIIPIKDFKNRYFDDCLKSIEIQDYSYPYEIIVVSGGNRAQARNHGIQIAKGDIIAFIDSDCIAPKHWLSTIIDNLEANVHIKGVGGYGISDNKLSLIGKAIDYVYSTYLGSLNSPSIYSGINKVSSKIVDGLSAHNSAYWKNTLIELGGFDVRFDLNEDSNLHHKIESHKYQLLLIPKIYVYHRRKESIKEFFKKFFNYGMGRMRSILTNKQYFDLNKLLPFIGALIFLFFIYFYPLISEIFFLVYLTMVFYYGFRAVYVTRDILFAILVPIMFIIQHLSYFLGMMSGLFKGKWKKKKENVKFHVHSKIIDHTSQNIR